MSPFDTHKPFKATVVFCQIGEPEIIMQEDHPCRQEYSADAWASVIARRTLGYDWLSGLIRIITVTYSYGVMAAPVYEEKEDEYGESGRYAELEQKAS